MSRSRGLTKCQNRVRVPLATRHHRLRVYFSDGFCPAPAAGDRGTVSQHNRRWDWRPGSRLAERARHPSPSCLTATIIVMVSAWKSPSNSVCFRPPFGLAKFSFSSFRLRFVPVAQPDRASDFGSEGWGFESLQARHSQWLIMAHAPEFTWPLLRPFSRASFRKTTGKNRLAFFFVRSPSTAQTHLHRLEFRHRERVRGAAPLG